MVGCACVRPGAALSHSVRRGRRSPGRSPRPFRSVEVSVPDEAGPPRQLSVRNVCCSPRTGGAGPRVFGNHRNCHGRRLHKGRHRRLVHRHGPLDRGCRRPLRRHDPCRLRLRAVHGRPWRALRGRAPRVHGRPCFRWRDREAGGADRRLQATNHPRDAVLLPEPHRRDGTAGPGPRSELTRGRHLRRRAVDRRTPSRDRRTDGARCDRHLWSERSHGSRRGAGVRRNEGRPNHLGGPLLPRGHQPRHWRGRGRRRAG